MSTLKRGKNTVVAGAGDGGFTYRGAPGIGGFGGFFPIGTLFFFIFTRVSLSFIVFRLTFAFEQMMVLTLLPVRIVLKRS
jgi:hypothetical protein